MPTLDFRYLTLVRALEDDLLLAEPLFFPALSTLDDDRARLVRALGERVRATVEGLPAGDVYRRRPAGDPGTAEIEVELAPPRATVGWREPVTLTFHYVHWEHGDEAHVAFVPALGIEAVAASARGLETRLPGDILAALFRRGAAKSLRELVELQRTRGVDVVESRATVKVRSPREEREEAGARDEPESVLAKVATDLGDASPPRAFEVSKPVARLAEALSGERRPSVLLVGPSGAGKTAVVHELVRRRQGHGLGRTPFWSTTGARIVAGATGFGMWQERCHRLVGEASKAGAVLHVESLVELIGVGRSAGNEQGVAAFLRPSIERGDLQVIAECAPEQLAVVEREEPQLLAALQRIEIAAPDRREACAILRGAAGAAGPAHGRREPITDEAVETIDRLHRRFATYSALPGRPLRFLKNLLADRAGGAATGKDVVAAFAAETGLPRFLLDGDRPLRLDETREFFSRRVMGQPRAVDLVVDVLATVKAGLSPPGRPVSSMLFIGPTGVGKTETAKALAEFMYRSPARMIRIDMSEYVDRPAVDRLIGGSLASEGLLTAKIREQPFSVVLLDEFEKAHPSFFDLLLQVLGEGRLTDGAGRVADFGNAIVLMTSNLGVDSFGRSSPGFRPAGDRLRPAERHFTDRVREFVRPELFNRIDRIVPFAPLDRATIRAIARRELDKVRSRDGIRHRRISVDVDPAVVDFLADRGYEPRYGARPLQRAIDRRLATRLAECVNRYDADLPIAARVELVDGDVAVSARARRDEERAAGGAGASARDVASAVTRARRRVQLLDVSAFMQDVRNELHRLRDGLARLKWRKQRNRGWLDERRAAEADRTAARVERLQACAKDAKALMERAVRLEDDALSAFHAGRPLDTGAVRESLQALEDRRRRLAMAALLESDPVPERITLVLSGEDRQQVAGLAAAYLGVMRRREGRPTLDELHRHPPPPGAVALSAFRQKPADDQTGIVYARPVRHAARFLASPPEKLLGVALSVTGQLFNQLLRGEKGRHVFREKGVLDRDCRVDVVDGGEVDDFLPPFTFGRRAATKRLETRRIYDFSDECVFEPALKKRFAFDRKGSIDDAVSDAVDWRLSVRIDSELGAW